MPLYDALAFATKTLEFYSLMEQIKIIAAGKIITGFDILKAMALGASGCYSARGMMLALGCIQALICDSGKCPAGIATQDPGFYKGLHPTDKRVRIANFHAKTIVATKEIMEACGFRNLQSVHPSKFFRRISELGIESFEQIYFSQSGSFLKSNIHSYPN
jgi:glutamate synthase domain-containing protein 2